MKFQNEYHKMITLRKMQQIKEWQKSPADLEVELQYQRMRDQKAKEIGEQNIHAEPNELVNPETSPDEPIGDQ